MFCSLYITVRLLTQKKNKGTSRFELRVTLALHFFVKNSSCATCKSLVEWGPIECGQAEGLFVRQHSKSDSTRFRIFRDFDGNFFLLIRGDVQTNFKVLMFRSSFLFPLLGQSKKTQILCIQGQEFYPKHLKIFMRRIFGDLAEIQFPQSRRKIAYLYSFIIGYSEQNSVSQRIGSFQLYGGKAGRHQSDSFRKPVEQSLKLATFHEEQLCLVLNIVRGTTSRIPDIQPHHYFF